VRGAGVEFGGLTGPQDEVVLAVSALAERIERRCGQQPSYGRHGEAPASAYSLANAARCTLTGAVWAPPGKAEA